MYNVGQLVITALDEQYTVASAQAFMQGFYPPLDLSNQTISEIELTNPTLVLANSTYVS